MKNIIAILLLMLLPIGGYAQQIGFKKKYQNTIEGKNYYFTALLEHSTSARDIIQNSPVLKEIAQDKLRNLTQSVGADAQLKAMVFTEEEIETIGKEFARLYKKGNVLDNIFQQEIVPSGTYLQLITSDRAESIRRIWEHDARAINLAIREYGWGEKPEYPNIDSISFDVHSRAYREELIPNVVQNVVAKCELSNIFYAVPLNAMKTLMDVNGRYQSIDFEPLGETVNKKAYARAKTINFEEYPYTLILVLGYGPEEKGQKIHPEGKMRAEYAAVLWRKHLAPFIVVSGGRVHPYHTPYNEAEQMKDYLVNVQGVPEDAIIMEPHARHTTTNIRNTVRIMLSEDFPMNRPALITSGQQHIDYVLTKDFEKRCKDDMGMVPYRMGKKLDRRTVEFYPEKEATILDDSEPMDP